MANVFIFAHHYELTKQVMLANMSIKKFPTEEANDS